MFVHQVYYKPLSNCVDLQSVRLELTMIMLLNSGSAGIVLGSVGVALSFAHSCVSGFKLQAQRAGLCLNLLDISLRRMYR